VVHDRIADFLVAYPPFTDMTFNELTTVAMDIRVINLEKNKILPHQKIIAMGDATGKELEKLKIKKYTKPISFDDLGLVQAVLGIN
jgi:hypothetical protein